MLISIITVNYNDVIGIENTIKSVQNQTYTNFEHIIIDGNSNDGSKEVIKKYKKSFSYWLSEKDSGIYNAMNKGIKIAKGDYLFFLNSGDTFYDKQVLEKVSLKLEEGQDIFYGNLQLINKDKENKLVCPPKKLSFSFFLRRTIPHQAAFTKKALFENISYYNEEYRIVSDWEFFMIAILKFNASYKHSDITISNYDTNGISSLPEFKVLFKNEKKRSLEKHFSHFIGDYTELRKSRNILKSNRFKILLELENSNIAKKINSFLLRINLFIFKGKRVKDL